MTIIIGRMFGVNLEIFLNKSIYILIQTYLRSHTVIVHKLREKPVVDW